MDPELKSDMDAVRGGESPNRVVMADDDEHVRRQVRRALDRQPDFTLVAEAADGASVLEAVDAHQPDVVLLDVAMLVSGGLDTLPLIRRQCPTAIVVVLSGARVSNESRAEALRLGAHGYLETSGSPSRLVAHLRELLGTGPTAL